MPPKAMARIGQVPTRLPMSDFTPASRKIECESGKSQQEGWNECWGLHSLNSVKVVVLLASQENLPLSFWNGQEAVSFG